MLGPLPAVTTVFDVLQPSSNVAQTSTHLNFLLELFDLMIHDLELALHLSNLILHIAQVNDENDLSSKTA